MKVERRSVPLDMLSVSEGEYKIVISTHRNEIAVSIYRVGKCVMNKWLSLPEFVSLLLSRKGS